MIGSSYLLLLSQASPTLIERWISGKEGVLGLSLILNVVLFNVAWYLLRLVLKFVKEVSENSVETTRALTELTTIIKERAKE